jgi:hypothetical protein
MVRGRRPPQPNEGKGFARVTSVVRAIFGLALIGMYGEKHTYFGIFCGTLGLASGAAAILVDDANLARTLVAGFYWGAGIAILDAVVATIALRKWR